MSSYIIFTVLRIHWISLPVCQVFKRSYGNKIYFNIFSLNRVRWSEQNNLFCNLCTKIWTVAPGTTLYFLRKNNNAFLTGCKICCCFQNATDDNGLAVSKSIKVIKCNGLKTKPFGRNGEAEYVSQVVVIGMCTLITVLTPLYLPLKP